MQKVPLKYRAKVAHKYNDEMVEGSLLLRTYAPFIYGEKFCVKVDPATLQKLAGYDKDGNEIYKTYRLKRVQIEGGLYEYSL